MYYPKLWEKRHISNNILKTLHCSLKSNLKHIFSPLCTNLSLVEESIFDWISSLQEYNGGHCLFSTYYTDPGFKLPGSIQRMCLTRRNFHEKIRSLTSKKMFCFKSLVKENVFWYFCLIFESVHWLSNTVIFCFKKWDWKTNTPYNWFTLAASLHDVDNGYLNEHSYMPFKM